MELLCVVTILSLLVGVIVFSVTGQVASQKLAAAARQLSADLNYATLLAGKENRPVELRFYKLASTSVPGTPAYRGYQVGIVTGWDAEARPEVTFKDEMQRFPDDVIFIPNADYTTLYPDMQHGDSTPASAPDAAYMSYFISSSGSTTLEQQKPTVFTLVRESAKGSPSQLPDDYRSVVIDPQQHLSRVY